MLIYTAINISMAVPYIFCPIKYNNCTYCDGGVSCNVPFKFSKNKKKTLALIYNVQDTVECDNIFSYCRALIDISANDIKMLRKYKYNCLNLYHGKYSAFKFDQTEEKKLNGIQISYLLTRTFFNRKKMLYKYFYLLRKKSIIDDASLSPV